MDAVGRLPFLNDSYYQDILCEIGGMFAVAKNVDNIHKRPWIGFQSWRAAGRKVYVSLVVLKHIEGGEEPFHSLLFWSFSFTDTIQHML